MSGGFQYAEDYFVSDQNKTKRAEQHHPLPRQGGHRLHYLFVDGFVPAHSVDNICLKIKYKYNIYNKYNK